MQSRGPMAPPPSLLCCLRRCSWDLSATCSMRQKARRRPLKMRSAFAPRPPRRLSVRNAVLPRRRRRHLQLPRATSKVVLAEGSASTSIATITITVVAAVAAAVAAEAAEATLTRRMRIPRTAVLEEGRGAPWATHRTALPLQPRRNLARRCRALLAVAAARKTYDGAPGSSGHYVLPRSRLAASACQH